MVRIEGNVSDGHEAERMEAVRAAARSAVTPLLPSYRIVASRPDARANVFRVGTSSMYNSSLSASSGAHCYRTELRAFLLEDIYGQLSLLFPDADKYDMDAAAQVFHIGVPAVF